jgi:hypothetical protein
MMADQIRKLHRALPFKPFTIQLADGHKIPVKCPEFMWITPGGSMVVVARGAHEEDGAEIIDPILVTKLTAGRGHKKS